MTEKSSPRRPRCSNPWVAVTLPSGCVAGHVRRLSGPFEAAERWAVRGNTTTFTCSLMAMECILRRNGMQHQVKTALSHRYFDGVALDAPAEEAASFPRRHVAEQLAERMDNQRSWDRVCVIGVHEEWS